MDNQNVFVIGGAVVGMFVIGGILLSGPEERTHARPTYAADDIRYKFQQEELKNGKRKKTVVEQEPIYATGTSSNAPPIGTTSEHEEPSVFDHEPQEEPPLD